MQIVEIRDMSVPLLGNVSNALVNFSEHTVSLVAVISDVIRHGKPVTGVAFNSIGRFAQSGLLRERFIPRVVNCPVEKLLDASGSVFSPDAVYKAAMCNEKPGGHGDRAAAVAALELAFWDLNAKLADEPAHITIARATGRQFCKAGIPVYAAGGYYYPGESVKRLREELNTYRELGFSDFKIKVGGASFEEDLERIHIAVDLAGGGQHIAIDANGRFDFDTAMRYTEAIAPLNLRWFEEVGDPLDFALNAEISRHYSGRIATGENLFSSADVMNLLRFGGMRPGFDVFQMDAGLSYGLSEFLKTVADLEGQGFSRKEMLPHGGHLVNLHIVAGLGLGGCEVYPGVFQPFGGYPPGCMTERGYASPTDAPGFGLEEKPDLKKMIDTLLA